LVTRFRICVRGVLCWSTFPSALALRTTDSATGCPVLFAGFAATTAGSSATAPRLPDAGQDGLPLLAGRGISQVPTRSLRAWWGLRPRQGVSASHDGAAHVAFGYTKSLGPYDITAFAAQYPTPHDCCVRFAVVVASHSATLTTRPALPLTWAGLSPAGSHQLPGALASQFEV
jgi:hypothetical protein